MTTSKARLLTWAAAIILCVELFASGAAHAGAPKNIPKTLPGGGVLTPDTTHRCPPGGFLLYVFPDGAGRCLMPAGLPPRSQADCSPGTTFRVLSGWPVCDSPPEHFPLHPAGEPAAQIIYCRSDADCPNGSVCYLRRIGPGWCGIPPGHSTVHNNR